MANDRLKAAVTDAGLDDEQLAALVEVDVKTVQRWLSGRATPRARHRIKVAQAVGREPRWLWPGVDVEPPAQDGRREIIGAYAHANDLRAPDWRGLLTQASQQIELCDYTLTDILSTAGTVAQLAAKASAGAKVKILIAGKDSLWVAELARQLGQEQDAASQTALQRDIDLARGHLQPLLTVPNVEVASFYAQRQDSILRFDDHMLITLHLSGRTGAQAPLLHLRRDHDDGLFDQFAAHLHNILATASEPLAPDPDGYPDPVAHPERYQPVTPEADTKARQQLGQQAQVRLPSGERAAVRQQLSQRNERQGPT